MTGLLLLLVPEDAPAQASLRADSLTGQATAEATGALRGLWSGFVGVLPKLVIASLLLAGAWVAMHVVRPVVRIVSRRTEHGRAIGAMLSIVVWLVAFGSALSVLAGDVRALVGSLGLVGLALSWSLQGPIESVTGWLLNSFKGYYRPGDRIAVGDVQGDVVRIDVLNTTVWEIGGPGSPSGISAEQPTGRLITFPNSEVVSGTVVNYTRDFSFVWDELAITVAAESDLRYVQALIEEAAQRSVGEGMAEPARAYAQSLEGSNLEQAIAETPEVYLRMSDWGADFIVRYLVDVRARRGTKSRLELALSLELAREEHSGRVVTAFPRQQLQMLDASGKPSDWPDKS